MKAILFQASVSLAITVLSIIAYDRFRIHRVEQSYQMDKTRLDTAVSDSLKCMNEISCLKNDMEEIKTRLSK